MALHGDVALIAAPGEGKDLIGPTGAAYFFEWTGGGWDKVYRAQGKGELSGFGSAVAFDGDWAVVGSPSLGAQLVLG